jgi:hypothetical protein
MNDLLSDVFYTYDVPIASPYITQARVIVTLGMKDAVSDRVDHLFASKLRVLCGRRKKNITLLGGAWCEELDGGDPLVVSRVCAVFLELL